MGWKHIDTLNPTFSPEKYHVGKQVSGENDKKQQNKYSEAINNTCQPLNGEWWKEGEK